jgi:aspartate aminotransferase-like enzyme
MADTVWNDARPGDVVLILSNGAFGGIYKIFREKAEIG